MLALQMLTTCGAIISVLSLSSLQRKPSSPVVLVAYIFRSCFLPNAIGIKPSRLLKRFDTLDYNRGVFVQHRYVHLFSQVQLYFNVVRQVDQCLRHIY